MYKTLVIVYKAGHTAVVSDIQCSNIIPTTSVTFLLSLSQVPRPPKSAPLAAPKLLVYYSNLLQNCLLQLCGDGIIKNYFSKRKFVKYI